MLLTTGAAAAGCASGGAEHDVAELRRDLGTVMTGTQRLRTETESQLAQADRRQREQQAETARQIAGLSTRLETLTAELSRLSTRVEDVARRLESVRAEAARPRPDAAAAPGPSPAAPPPVAARPAAPAPPAVVAPAPPAPPAATAPAPPAVTAPAPPAPAAPVTPPPMAPAPGGPVPPLAGTARPAAPAAPPAVAPAPSSPATPAPPRSTAGVPTAEESYQAAFADLTRGRYQLAVQGFREFLRRYPDSPLRDDAQYGIGEAYFSLARATAGQGQADQAKREWEQAAMEFRKVSVHYPRGQRVPTALYKEALALTELKQTALAQVRLQYLVDNFPQSAEAPLARERLAALKR